MSMSTWMGMSAGEIVRSYREAEKKKKQIQILAELNCCTPADIRTILRDNGVQLPGPSPKAVTAEIKPEDFEEVVAGNEPPVTGFADIKEDADKTATTPEEVKSLVRERTEALKTRLAILVGEEEKVKTEMVALSRWLRSVEK